MTTISAAEYNAMQKPKGKPVTKMPKAKAIPGKTGGDSLVQTEAEQVMDMVQVVSRGGEYVEYGREKHTIVLVNGNEWEVLVKQVKAA